MPRPLRIPLVLLGGALAVLAAACGGGGDANRPTVLTTVPPPGTALGTVVDEFLVLYDEPIEILNPDAVRGYDRRGEIPMIVLRDPELPNALRVRPAPGFYLIPGSFGLELRPGLERNGDNQYRLEDWRRSFDFGEGSNLFLGSRGRGAVVEVDPDTFAEIDAVATPGGRAPLGLRGTLVGTDVRIWVQLDDGGGVGRPLAWFSPGDASMNEVDLTTGGGDLVTSTESIALGRDGIRIYTVFRDEALGRVRLSEIDVRTATETRTLVLSPPAGPDTAPIAIRTSPLGADVLVTCRTPDEDRLCAVRVSSFTERNIGPDEGVDGFVLADGGGALSTFGDVAVIANEPQPTGSLTAVRWTNPVGVQGVSPSAITGSPQDVFITPDGLWLLTALADFEEDRGLIRRSRALFFDPLPRAVASTTSGANAPATVVRKFVTYRTQARFLTLFDNDAVGRWGWDLTDIVQEDLDDVLEGVQAADLSTIAPDVVSGTFVSGFFPP